MASGIWHLASGIALIAVSLAANRAEAILVCGLTPAQVNSVDAYYGLEGSFNDFAYYLEAPFDCERYGEACFLMGEYGAHTLSCDVWDMLLAHEPLEDIAAFIEVEADYHMEQWEALRFPNGIPDDHPFWGSPTPPPPASCVGHKGYAMSGDSLYKAWGKSYAYWLAAPYFAIGGRARAYERATPSSSWRRDPDATVTAVATYSSTSGSTVCTSTPESATDTDGNVYVQEWIIALVGFPTMLWESVETVSSTTYGGYPLSVTTCKTALWQDLTCL